MEKSKKKLSKEFYIPIFLFFVNIFIWSFYFGNRESDILKVSFLDIGQGDAIFIEAPNGRQMLIDSGRDTTVLNELGKVMGFFDRQIDIVLGTHPDQDHIGGIPGVLENYKVLNFIDSFAETDTNTYREMNELVKKEGANYFIALRGQVVVLDKKRGVYLHVLYPNPDDFKYTETNDLSTIVKLVYGDTSFILTGDAPKIVETMLYSTDKNYLKASVLKAGHHGSKTSSSPTFVKMVAPTYAVISAGKDNSYGHPHAEVMKTLENSGTKILETSKDGTITFESNGVDVWRK